MTDFASKNDLRVKDFTQFIGQPQTVAALKIALSAAKTHQRILEHTLLYGPPGLGKTTLAQIIASTQGVNIRITSGPSLTKVGDLASLLTQLCEGDVLFIDEIHRLNKSVEETLYPAMEDFALDMVIGKGPGSRSVRLELARFTLIGATTKAGHISAPLRDRFGHVYRLEYYSPEELATIITQAAVTLNSQIDTDSALEIAKRSRGTARIALKLLRRILDYHLVQKLTLNLANTIQALNFYELDTEGLDATDRKLLSAIITYYQGGPVGLETLASLISEDINTITDVYEPFLMQSGFLTRTPKGRTVTTKAYSHLHLEPASK